jgi:hypothetical protein
LTVTVRQQCPFASYEVHGDSPALFVRLTPVTQSPLSSTTHAIEMSGAS